MGDSTRGNIQLCLATERGSLGNFREVRGSCYGRCVPKSRLAGGQSPAYSPAATAANELSMPRRTLRRRLETLAWLLPLSLALLLLAACLPNPTAGSPPTLPPPSPPPRQTSGP